MSLKDLFDKHHTDKSSKHKYHEIYEPLWEPIRDKEINILEVGVWKGHGLAAMHEYFPNANLYGIDIFSRITPEEVDILKEDRVKWVKGDSTNIVSRSLIENAFGVEFDIILDDGAHCPASNMKTFQTLSPLLKDDGMYIIEDVWPLERMTPKECAHPWLKRWPNRYNDLANNNFLAELLKSGLEIKRYDNRKKSGEPDSYIITLNNYK